VAAACIVAALSPAVATAQPKAQVWWLDLGPAAWWDNSSFFATVTVVYGRTYGHDDTYAWGTAYDKRTRYQCGAYYESQPGQFVVDPTFSIAVSTFRRDTAGRCESCGRRHRRRSSPYMNVWNGVVLGNPNWPDQIYAGTLSGLARRASAATSATASSPLRPAPTSACSSRHRSRSHWSSDDPRRTA